MIFWFVIAAMTVLALAFVVIPLLRKNNATDTRDAYDISVYKDQLSEIDRDLNRGLINEGEATAARVEVQRRILSLDDQSGDDAEKTAAPPATGLALSIAAMVPVGAILIYLMVGSPGLPDTPSEGRNANMAGVTQEQAQMIQKMVQRLADKMKANPEDKKGWVKLAISYSRLGKYQLSADAYRKAAALETPEAELMINLGLALTRAGDGNISDEAQTAFLRGLKGLPNSADALYHLGMAEVQRDAAATGLSYWKHLVDNSPSDAPYLPTVRDVMDGVANDSGIDLATVEAKFPDTSGVEAPAISAENKQAAFIQKMVARLEAKTKADPTNFTNLMTLGRSYRVLGRMNDAIAAYAQALDVEPDNTDAKVGKASAILQRAEQTSQKSIPTEAVALLKSVQSVEPDNPDALYVLGFVESRAGNTDVARALWTRLRDQFKEGAPDYTEVQTLIDGLP